MFKKKKEKIKLIGNAPSEGLVELFPLQKGVLPDFFKRLPKNNLRDEGVNNIRVCTGLTDLFQNSITIPAWQDMTIRISADGHTDVNAPQERWSATQHPLPLQAPGVWEGYVNVKLSSPWLIECNKDVRFTMIQPTWNQKNPNEMVVVPGVLEFKYQNQSNINLIFPIPKSSSKIYEIKAGDIVAMLVPQFTEDYDLECKYINQLEADRLLTSRWQFTHGPAYARLRAFLRNKK